MKNFNPLKRSSRKSPHPSAPAAEQPSDPSSRSPPPILISSPRSTDFDITSSPREAEYKLTASKHPRVLQGIEEGKKAYHGSSSSHAIRSMFHRASSQNIRFQQAQELAADVQGGEHQQVDPQKIVVEHHVARHMASLRTLGRTPDPYLSNRTSYTSLRSYASGGTGVESLSRKPSFNQLSPDSPHLTGSQGGLSSAQGVDESRRDEKDDDREEGNSVEPQPQIQLKPSQSTVTGMASSTATTTTTTTTLVAAAEAPTTRVQSAEPPPPRDPAISQPRIRSTPRIVHDKDAEEVSPMAMLWYRAPVHGEMPGHSMRSHSATMIANKIWVIGGYDEKQTYRDIYCFDIDTLQWTHPGFKGDLLPPCRGHTATAIGYKIVVIGGGLTGNPLTDPVIVHVFDTLTQTWIRPQMAPGCPHPSQRRAHSAVVYDDKIWVFGGGNGIVALGDLWNLDVSCLVETNRSVPGGAAKNHRGGQGVTLKWQLVETVGQVKPGPRGYHTADAIEHLMVVIGGADGKETLGDAWVLNLESLEWKLIHGLRETCHRRLGHTSTRVGSYLFLWGGIDSKEYKSELCMLNLITLEMEHCQVFGKPPPPRAYHVALLGDSRIWVIGGANSSGAFDDVYILELASHSYLQYITEFDLEPLEEAGIY